jgi:hypothetical protein
VPVPGIGHKTIGRDQAKYGAHVLLSQNSKVKSF